MNVPDAEALVERSAEARSSSWGHWRMCLLTLAVAFAALLLVYFDSFRSMAAIWSRSDTFVHGYFVLPISLYLIWTRREELRALTPRPDARALFAIALVGFGWLAARLGGVLVAEQYFAVASVPLLVWAVAGSSVTRKLLFPLSYLLLMVPVGEALLPYLIDYTAAFTVTALRISGVPVLQEGNLLTLPNSQWSVVEACSGLRYLIACVTIGLVFAYLTYRSWWRRALFIGLSVTVPIVANWVRAYLIVLIGYASDMRLAVGIDHFIYGWVFYAVVMFLLLWAGSRFSDHDGREPAPMPPAGSARAPSRQTRSVLTASAAMLAAAIWPVWASYSESAAAAEPPGASASRGLSFSFPPTLGSWSHLGEPTVWEPRYVGATFTRGAVYDDGESRVGVHVALYGDQRQGAELVSWANSLAPREVDEWHQRTRESLEISLLDGRHGVEEALLMGPEGKLLVWRWYCIGGTCTASSVWAKVIEVKGKLLLRPPLAAGIVAFTDGTDAREQGRARLEKFLGDGLPFIESALKNLSASKGGSS
jgi:exosortase A